MCTTRVTRRVRVTKALLSEGWGWWYGTDVHAGAACHTVRVQYAYNASNPPCQALWSHGCAGEGWVGAMLRCQCARSDVLPQRAGWGVDWSCH